MVAEARQPGTFAAVYTYEPVLYNPPAKGVAET